MPRLPHALLCNLLLLRGRAWLAGAAVLLMAATVTAANATSAARPPNVIARWPGRIPAQTQRGGPGILMDLLPTFLEAAGLPAESWPKVDGESLLPLLKGEGFERKTALHWETQNNAAVLEGGWKLVHRFWEERPRLYHLANDIGEDKDLAAQFPDRVARMMTLHAEWKQRSYPNPLPRITQPTGRFPQR